MTMLDGQDEQIEELKLLKESVRTLLAGAGGRNRTRSARWSNSGVDRKVWKELADAGILGVLAGEDSGGLCLGLRSAGVIAEEFGRALAPEPFGSAVGLIGGLSERLCPDDPLLAKIIEGEAVCALAWQERGPFGYSRTRETRFSGTKLSGMKAWVANTEGQGADVLLVIAESADGPALCHVDPSADGLTLDPVRQSDGSFLCDIVFSDTPAELVASGPQVEEALSAAVDDATALAAAEMIGVTSEALNLTREFLETREQFGKPIGEFQALQHRTVDMYTSQHIAEAGIREALVLMDKTSDPQERSRQASRAKARAGEVATMITRDAIQMHGAIGYTDEFDIGLYLNRSLALSAWLGDAAYHRRRWIDLNEKRNGYV